MLTKNYFKNAINASEFSPDLIERVKNHEAVILTDDSMADRIVDSPSLQISKGSFYMDTLAFPVRKGFKLRKFFNTR